MMSKGGTSTKETSLALLVNKEESKHQEPQPPLKSTDLETIQQQESKERQDSQENSATRQDSASGETKKSSKPGLFVKPAKINDFSKNPINKFRVNQKAEVGTFASGRAIFGNKSKRSTSVVNTSNNRSKEESQ